MASTSKVPLPPADADGSQLTYNETIDAICGFIKTAIHTILCHRQVYPSNVFTRRQRYRVPVWASRHPGLTAYIDDVIGAARAQIAKANVHSIHIVLSSIATQKVLERYRFDVDFLLGHVQLRDRNLSIPGNMTAQTMELHMRAFMQKLISLDGALYDVEDVEDLTWSLVLDMKPGKAPETDDKLGSEPSQGPWMPFDEDTAASVAATTAGRDPETSTPQSAESAESLRARPRRQEPKEDDDSLILPVKSLDTGVINLMLYVEEHPQAKRQQRSQSASQGSSSINNSHGSGSGSNDKITSHRKAPTLPLGKKSRRAPLASTGKSSTSASSDLPRHEVERDLDEPQQLPTSSGAVASSKVKKRRKVAMGGVGGGAGQKEETDTSDDEQDSASSASASSNDSIRSVNDFAGYAGNAGGAGMAGTRM